MAFNKHTLLLLLLVVFPKAFAQGKCADSFLCAERNGQCVPSGDCDATDPTIVCDPICSKDCTCRYEKEPTTCKITKKCARTGGQCVENCNKLQTNGLKCKNWCDSDLGCKCLTCDQSEKCIEAGGVCAMNCKETDKHSCKKELCEHDSCACRIPNPVDCAPKRKCTKKFGECVFPCVAPAEGLSCQKDWCQKKTNCECLYTSSCPRTPACIEAGGTCELKCKNKPGKWKCLQDKCENKGCYCKVPDPDCAQKGACKKRRGVCVHDCVEENGIGCGKFCETEKDCLCKVCKNSNTCKQAGGRCRLDCIEEPGVTCKEELCPNDKCSCEIVGEPVPDETKTCFVHPDPHFRNWDGIYYDFQHGCDVILVTSDEIEVHLRLNQKHTFPISGVESLAIRIKNSNSIESTGDILEITEAGSYYFNDNTRSTLNPSLSTIAGYPFTHVGNQFEISFSAGHYIRVQAYPSSSSTNWGLSITIRGHSNMFAYADGMCGDWDLSGLRARDDTLVTGQQLGDDWQVGVGGSSDAVILSDVTAVTPSLPGHAIHPDGCYDTRRRLIGRELKERTCTFCENMKTVQQKTNCYYDANVAGCDWVSDTKMAPFYDQNYNQENIDFYHPEIIESDQCYNTEECAKMPDCMC